jgi:undecaprenyl pyrophosphate synthase
MVQVHAIPPAFALRASAIVETMADKSARQARLFRYSTANAKRPESVQKALVKNQAFCHSPLLTAIME